MASREGCLKVLLIVLNVLLTLVGIAFIAFSVYELNNVSAGTFQHVAIVVQIFVGTFVVLSSFLGCFAGARLSLSLIWSFVSCMLILIGLQVYIIVAAHVTDYVERSRTDFMALWADQRRSKERIAFIEQKYTCCGQSGPQDYILQGVGFPLSCYDDKERLQSKLHGNGCLEAVQSHATDNLIYGLISKWLLFALELGALGAATHLGITVRNKQRRERF
ncbi:PREDICTED: protein late bloomer [Drosophila arizonae]|uniref:Protein late bloomer n=1 Tax=Drosophila arizonae TaxID=7263 RepID=A0ABM1PLZ0_DROAR|nr:PREDICTED: protein late bloomer [Drosophila arizonae]